MASFTALLVHSADVYTRTDVNTGGRITQTWTKQTTVQCRFSSPVSTRVSPVAGASVEQIDATVFVGPELLNHVSSSLPFRLVTTSNGWEGTYEVRTKPRVICAGTNAVHHCECDCVEAKGEPLV